MKRLILLLIVFFAGCNALSSVVNRGGVGINSAGNISTGGATSTIDVSKMKDAYLPNSKQSAYTKQKYLVEEKDVLDIQVHDEPDLSITSRVSEKGEIWVPLLENVEVKGLTIQETEKFLETRLEDGFLKDPKVTVSINTQQMLEYSEKEVFVSGQVNKPGSIPLLGKYMTVFEAVNKAGGLTEIAWPSRTRVIREENGVKSKIKVNLRKVKKGDKSRDILVKPGDVIYVPETIF
jgi:polysaccharide export outer membrane protein